MGRSRYRDSRGSAEDKTIIKIRVTVDSRGLEVNPDHQLEDLKLNECLLTKIKIDVSIADSLVILPKKVLRGTHCQVRCSIEKKIT